MTPRRVTLTDALALVVVAGEWTGLARAIVGSPLYAAGLDVLLVGLLLLSANQAIRARHVPPRSVTLIAIAVYMVFALIEIANPNVPGVLVGAEGYRKTAFTTIATFVVVMQRGGDARRFFAIIALGSIPALIWGIRQFFGPLPVEIAIIEGSGVSSTSFHAGMVLRAFAPTAGPFHLGIISASVMVISIVFARRDARWLLLGALAAVALGLTLTRANMLAAAVGVAVAVVLAQSWRLRVTSTIQALGPVAVLLVAALFASGALSAAPPGSAGSPGSSGSVESVDDVVAGVTDPLEDKNLQYRFEFWGQFVKAIAERPVIGYGTSAAADGFARHYEGTDSVRFQPHSMYFKAALELGVGGLIVFLVILVGLAVTAWRTRAENPELVSIGMGIGAVMTISGITGPMLDAYPMNVLFWATAGWILLTAATRRSSTPSA
jgi:hypothetical protein